MRQSIYDAKPISPTQTGRVSDTVTACHEQTKRVAPLYKTVQVIYHSSRQEPMPLVAISLLIQVAECLCCCQGSAADSLRGRILYSLVQVVKGGQ